MARTCQRVIDRVVEILKDEAHVRYTETQILNHIVDAITQIRAVRPDVFVASYATPLPDSLSPATPLPVPDQYFAGICYYVAGSCELRDDEFAVDGRAMTLRDALVKKLVSGM